MESPLATRIFRELFSRPARHCLHQQARLAALQGPGRRHASALRHKEDDGSGRSNWQQRLDHFPPDITKELKQFPRVTAAQLRNRSQRPTRVKMYTREFIDDSLYNPNYGYFSKHATIFTPTKPFDFNAIKDEAEFNNQINQNYADFEEALDEIAYDPNRQLWHTPTELFQPHYGHAIARYLVTNYKMTLFPYHDLIIYEMGAGNGTMMRNILDYIRDTDPSVYARTKYRIIEISSSLHSLQKTSLSTSISDPDHLEHVELINSSIFNWKTPVPHPCFFLALEVIDNFAHDAIRYDPYTEQPMQGSVLITEDGEFVEFYDPNIDPLAARYLKLRQLAARAPFRNPLSNPPAPLRKLLHSLPFAPNLTKPEYIPTRLMQFFDVLSNYFPHHRLVLADFTALPDTAPGFNGPIVQTRFERRNIAMRTPFVHQGYFDIFFPTDFGLMEDLYRMQTGKLTRVKSHEEWLRGWEDDEGRTVVKSGEDVMRTFYQNQAVMTTL
ncbi:NADH dehydrogenase-like protein [Cyphellophora attinorum]|uniref:Protein arginine methyltransferase NDUFAF7 n=1 Tax=Cyphellophora attinorum TaxID=1664694 RepID=A0A0N1P1X0_9EURO|nr:NADH dehydrogenase-like protein [Phialophora attinorum]KPI45152.1 NADH dehydrogenase-like protein [Phialophora attinorum]